MTERSHPPSVVLCSVCAESKFEAKKMNTNTISLSLLQPWKRIANSQVASKFHYLQKTSRNGKSQCKTRRSWLRERCKSPLTILWSDPLGKAVHVPGVPSSKTDTFISWKWFLQGHKIPWGIYMYATYHKTGTKKKGRKCIFSVSLSSFVSPLKLESRV